MTMKPRCPSIALLALTCTLMAGGGCATVIPGQNGSNGGTGADTVTCAPPQGTTGEFETAKIYIEHNAADEDTGVHGIVGVNGTSETCIFDSSGQLILAVKPQGNLGDLGVADTFFESREPPNTEPGFTIDDILAKFPEGTYTITGVSSVDGQSLTGTALFTHVIPEAPVITWPQDEVVVPSENLVVSWEPVTQSIRGEVVDITGYEVIITKDVDDDPNGFSRPTLSVHLPPSQTSLTVPDEFLELGTPYELEVLAIEFSGNQTIGIIFFETEEEPTEKTAVGDAKVFFEQNSTSADTGFHLAIADTDPWNALTVTGPDGRGILSVHAKGPLADFGLASLFFESQEPPNDEVPIDQIRERFSAGEYQFQAKSIDGVMMESTAILSHAIPEGFPITSPEEGVAADHNNVVIAWEVLTITSPWGRIPKK